MNERTRSVCPVCLRPVEAARIGRKDGIYLHKKCPEHGAFMVPIWRGRLDFDSWRGGSKGLPKGQGLHCPEKCGICDEHEQGTCCALLEVTQRCNLHCRFCFADGGGEGEEPGFEELKQAIALIMERCGRPLLQLSGGEPSLRDDLPQLIRYAKSLGCPYVQLNTNGIRLAEDMPYVQALAQAGLSFVFLQFDGVTEEVYRTLRGRDLFEIKRKAIENCGRCRLGVTLVPTVVRGVNETALGDIIRFGALLSPVVRGIHFQPVSFFGRYPERPEEGQRYTLDELLSDICRQTGLPFDAFLPSCCDHPLCGFHAAFLTSFDGTLTPVNHRKNSCQCGRTTAAQNREYIGRHWTRRDKTMTDAEGTLAEGVLSAGVPNMELFLRQMRAGSFTLTAMAFQDAMNLDVERLHRCSLHVYDNGTIKPFCAKYLTAVKD